MTGTHHHSITPAHKHDETPAETVHVVKPSSQHKPVESDPIKEAAKDRQHEQHGQLVGSLDGKIPHGMTGNEVGNH